MGDEDELAECMRIKIGEDLSQYLDVEEPENGHCCKWEERKVTLDRNMSEAG